jgi:hypothetical protein
MNHANPATYDVARSETTLPATLARAAAEAPTTPASRAYPRPAAGCSVTPHPASTRQLREEGGYYVPDFLTGKHDEADPAHSEAAHGETEGLVEAMALLDEVCNLVAVLKASMEEDADAQASQVETVLKIVEKKLDKAHRRIDRQAQRHRNLFLAYCHLKDASARDAE